MIVFVFSISNPVFLVLEFILFHFIKKVFIAPSHNSFHFVILMFIFFSQLQKRQRIYGIAMGMTLGLTIRDLSKRFRIVIIMSAWLLRRH